MFGRSDRVLMRVELARLEGTSATLVKTVAAFSADIETRVRRVERWMYSLGAISTIAAAIAVAWKH